MVLKCCIKGCRSECYAGCGVSFHRFPKNEEIKQEWLQLMENKISKHSVVCGLHFKPKDFISLSSCTRKTLVPTAVPSIFSVPNKFGIAASNNMKQELLDIGIVNEQSSNPSSPDQPLYQEFPDDSSTTSEMSDSSSPVKPPTKKFKSVAVQTTVNSSNSGPCNEKLRKQVKILTQRLKRRDSKINNLKELLYLSMERYKEIK